MTEYRVVWEVDLEADTPKEAAVLARDYQTREGTHAVVFDVRERRKGARRVRVDLLDDEEGAAS